VIRLRLTLFGAFGAALLLGGCVTGAIVGAAVGTAGAVVGAGIDATGAVVGAAIPGDGEDDKDNED